MNHLQRLIVQFRRHLALVFVFANLLILLSWVVGLFVFDLDPLVLMMLQATEIVVFGFVFGYTAARYVSEPLRFLWQAILHVSPEHQGTAAPNLERCRVGRELVTSLALQVYQFASGTMTKSAKSGIDTTLAQTALGGLPLPLLVIDKQGLILYANKAALEYLQISEPTLEGKDMYSVMNLLFQNDYTLDRWVADSRTHKVTATNTWERVKLLLPDEHKTVLQLDLAAYYSKDNPAGLEVVLALFDHTATYSKDDDQISFVALAVHELRAPLTILRGYIEVFEDEFQGKLNDELTNFMFRLKASAEQLNAFVNNILNVARVEENQLILRLREESWTKLVRAACADLQMRARVHNKTIEVHIPDNLPTVGVDPVSIIEVINNLIDNAIKYSADGQKIIVNSYVKNDGLVETTVQDFGVGIPTSVIPDLFDKFYRSHRTRASIGGTGLGLYLSKVIVDAHGGQIWVQSKEGMGSTFGFTLRPYSQLADELKNSDNKGIVRGAHGWIKNHSLYRR